MVYDSEGDINFDAWVRLNKDVFPPEAIESFETNKDILYIITSVYPKINRAITPALRRLMYKQYPVLRTEMRPLVVEFIEDTLYITGTVLFLMKMYRLVHGHNTGVNIRDLYPDLDSWVDFYCRPAKPPVLKDVRPETYFWITDEEWKIEAAEEYESMLEFFNWEQTRQAEFINLVQKIYFKYYPELLNLSADEWVIFAVDIREEYESFKLYCSHVEEFIDCGFPEEDMKLTDKEYFDKYCTLPEEVREKAREIRDRRIAGERI